MTPLEKAALDLLHLLDFGTDEAVEAAEQVLKTELANRKIFFTDIPAVSQHFRKELGAEEESATFSPHSSNGRDT
jgi:hypothetical protein